MELKRIDLLNKIKLQNEKLLTKEDLDFLEFKSQQELLQLNVIDDWTIFFFYTIAISNVHCFTCEIKIIT